MNDAGRFIPLRVYPGFEKAITFYFGHQMSLNDMEKLIINDCLELKTGIEFYISDGTKDVLVTDKSMNFLHLMQYENMKMKSANRTISYEVLSPHF